MCPEKKTPHEVHIKAVESSKQQQRKTKGKEKVQIKEISNGNMAAFSRLQES